MDTQKLKQIVQNKVEFDPFYESFYMEDYQYPHEYFYSIVMDDNVYTVTKDPINANEPEVWTYEGWYIYKTTYYELYSLFIGWQDIAMNSKAWRAEVTEAEIERYNFVGSILKKLESGLNKENIELIENCRLSRLIYEKRQLSEGLVLVL